MIPSDHFVRFYNEVFKFLNEEGNGKLEAFWQEIGRHQERHCLELFRKEGLRGMYEYWEHIRIEENCDLEMELFEDRVEMNMRNCPSLNKNLDNDAPCFERYCDHCPAWIGHVLSLSGYWMVYDMIDRNKPQCRNYIYKDKEKAEKKLSELRQSGHKLLVTNLSET